MTPYPTEIPRKSHARARNARQTASNGIRFMVVEPRYSNLMNAAVLPPTRRV